MCSVLTVHYFCVPAFWLLSSWRYTGASMPSRQTPFVMRCAHILNFVFALWFYRMSSNVLFIYFAHDFVCYGFFLVHLKVFAKCIFYLSVIKLLLWRRLGGCDEGCVERIAIIQRQSEKSPFFLRSHSFSRHILLKWMVRFWQRTRCDVELDGGDSRWFLQWPRNDQNI